MGKLLRDEATREKWFSLSIGDQISNIGSEVLRADKWKKRGNYERMRSFYDAAIDFLMLSRYDPKNKKRISEFDLCIDELADYFIGENKWNTTSEKLERYYNSFLIPGRPETNKLTSKR